MATNRRFVRRHNFREQRKCFVIATEGAKTESRYLNLFKPLRHASFKMEVLPSRTHNSSPKHVLRRLKKFHRDNMLQKGDELWVVIDRDSWDKNALEEVVAGCKDAGFRLAVSNPCFELWLYIHFKTIKSFQSSKHCKRALNALFEKEGLGSYDESAYDPEIFRPKIAEAIQKAKKGDDTGEYEWPEEAATQVYRLVEKLSELTDNCCR